MEAQQKNPTIYHVEESCLDVFYTPILDRELDLLFASSKSPLILDFSQVEEVSSAILGLLLHKKIQFQKAGKDLVLSQVKPQIQKVLRILHLESQFLPKIAA